MCDCLLVNLTRFGDLIQSQALIHDLGRNGYAVGLVCQENFAKTCDLLDGVSQVFVLRGAALLREIASEDGNWRNAFDTLWQFADTIRQQAQVRAVVNITPTLAARLLANLLTPPGAELYGFGLDGEGFGFNRGFWATFVSASTARRQNAVFNVTDMFRMLAQPIFGTPAGAADIFLRPAATPDKRADGTKDMQAVSEMLRTRLQNGNVSAASSLQGYIALQLGASSADRQWPVAYFAALASFLWESSGLCAVLTGGGSERELAAEFSAQCRTPHVDAVGATSLPQLASLLRTTRLLVTNDTGTLHLASALAVPSVSFFLATAQPWDTGPCLPGCLCIEPNLDCHPCDFRTPCARSHACLPCIEPTPIAECIAQWLAGSTWEESVRTSFAERIHSARLYETVLDANSRITLRPLNSCANGERTAWFTLQRSFWSHLLDDYTKTETRAEGIGAPRFSETTARALCTTLQDALTLLDALIEQSHLLEKSGTAQKVFLRNCDRLQTLFLTDSNLVSFGYFWREMRLDRGQNIADLRDCMEIFRRHIGILRGAIENGMKTA